MQEEIETIKRALVQTTENHEQSIQQMERKFFDEKIKLEKVAGNRIAELAERAHSEAVRQLDVTTRQVYQDNVRLTDALSKHIEENNTIRKENDNLRDNSEKLQLEIATNEKTVKRKILEARFYKDKATEMQLTVGKLDNELHQAIEYAEMDKSQALVVVSTQNEGLEQQVARLQRALELQSHDMRKLRRAANKVLKQRSDVEQFLVTALDHTRQEIRNSRNTYIKAMELSYQAQMQKAFKGEADYPPVTTFKKQLPHDKSTRSVYDKLSTAQEIDASRSGPIDIAEMTWEQREAVLRHLFAQINNLEKDKREQVVGIKKLEGAKASSSKPSVGLVPSSNSKTTLTQREVSKQALPPIRKTPSPVADNDHVASTTFLTEVQES